MSVCFEKARELGNLLLASEQGLRLADARAALEADDKSMAMLEEFKAYQNDVNTSMREGAMDQAQYTKASQIMLEKADALKKHPIVGQMIQAENEFYAFVNQVLGIVKGTLTGEIEEPSDGCDGESCGGCGGCHS